MKARLVYTSFWTNPEVECLSSEAKYLLLYCLTNPYIGLTGAFRLRDERIAYETGYPIHTLSKLFEELKTARFVDRQNGWVIVFNTEKHNNYSSGSKTGVAYKQEAEKLPKWVLDTLSIPYTSTADRVCIPPETEIEKETETEIEKETNGIPTTAEYQRARELADSLRTHSL